MNICLLLFFKRLARGLISHRGRHSFVTLLVTLAVTLSNQGRLWPERSRQDPTSSVCAQIFVAHSKSSCSSWGTKTRHTHTQRHTYMRTDTCTMKTKANHERRVCLLLLLFAHHHYHLCDFHHRRHSHWEWGLSCATSSV